MEPNALANWITAFAAVAYTIGSFALWLTTKKSVEAMRAAFKLNFLLAYNDAEGSGRLRILGAMGDKTAIRERMQFQALDRLLKKAFPKEYEELRAALRERQEGEAPSS